MVMLQALIKVKKQNACKNINDFVNQIKQMTREQI
jgi:hypothetical protein